MPRVVAYSLTELCALLGSGPENSAVAASKKLHTTYFDGYLRELAAKTVVVEESYVDHDFLEDFAAYYVRCFKQYSRYCTRLHFFSTIFDGKEFEGLFSGQDAIRDKLSDSYLGFIVVRPVPDRVVGRTCLATYPQTGGREFPVVQRFEANLFGLSLSVESIPFQEQDRAVAACATSALWSVFQGTGRKFHHRIPSPAEITRLATSDHPLEARAFPAGDGLMLVQMADAVRACDLEPLWLQYADAFFLRAAIHAYASAGIPLLLNGEVVNAATPKEVYGVHAVAVCGYKFAQVMVPESDGFTLWSSCIEKLYCHDDGVGPFARMEFQAQPLEDGRCILSSQARNKEATGALAFVPEALLVPIYHKIRVPFVRIYAEVRAFDNLVRALKDLQSDVPADLEWSIVLKSVNAYKAEALDQDHLEQKAGLLTAGLPRYLWLARATHKDHTGFDLVFDATGLEHSNLCLYAFSFGSRLLPILQKFEDPGALREYPECQGVVSTVLGDP